MSTNKTVKNKSLEENVKEIEAIVEAIESGEISLEGSIDLYKKGITILETCNTTLDKIEKELIILKEKK